MKDKPVMIQLLNLTIPVFIDDDEKGATFMLAQEDYYLDLHFCKPDKLTLTRKAEKAVLNRLKDLVLMQEKAREVFIDEMRELI